MLMYHYLSVPPANADIYRQDLSVTPENFEAQLAYLQSEGYTTISLDDLTYHLAGLRDLPPKPIILTFDDGYADNYTNAFPLLQKYGFQATFAIVTEPIDFGDPNYMTWAQVQEMHAAGMDFASHTRHHLDLRNRGLDFLRDQIIFSKEAIEYRLQEPVRYFVYPGGQYDQAVIDLLQVADFWGALTTQYGAEYGYADRFEMPRIRIRGEDDLTVFTIKLAVEE
jgi:peptidoglycan/xylan/chitin deacetylase (PgdA/CDA1 family)